MSGNNTTITINNEFIRTLSIGTYKLEAVFKSGRAQTTFTISEKQNQNTGNNQGQNNNNNNNQQGTSSGGNNYYRPTYGNGNYYDDDDDEGEEEKVNEEKQEENKEDTAIKQENDINLNDVLDVDKDNDDDADFEDDEPSTKKKTSMIDKIKSRYVPIIIVVVAILIGGTTAFIYLKAKEEDVRF